MVLENLDYYKRRIADELAAAERANCSKAAEAHRELAERYRTLCDEAVAIADAKVVRLPIQRNRVPRAARHATPAASAR